MTNRFKTFSNHHKKTKVHTLVLSDLTRSSLKLNLFDVYKREEFSNENFSRHSHTVRRSFNTSNSVLEHQQSVH